MKKKDDEEEKISFLGKITSKVAQKMGTAPAKHKDVELRVQHVDRLPDEYGDQKERLYKLDLRVMPDPIRGGVSIQFYNTYFLQRDTPIFIQRIRWFACFAKLCVFYMVLCGLMEMPSQRAMFVAMKLLAYPAILF